MAQQKEVKNTNSNWNELAVITGILCLIFTPAALFTGISSLKQIKKSGERGSGIAILGIILGALTIFIILIMIVFLIFFAGANANDFNFNNL